MTAAVRERATSADFDFWMGRWDVRNRRLVRRLAGSDEWDEFDSKVAARPLPGGLGNEDVFCTEYGGGFVGMSFRFFDPETDSWSIYWADTRRPGLLDPPVIGSFSDDVGVFEGDDTFEGRPIRVRFTWSGVTTPTPRWEQAFSDDGGETLGDELDHGLHAGAGGGRVSALEHGASRPTTATPRSSRTPSRVSRSATRSSSGTTWLRTRSPCRSPSGQSRAAACAMRLAPGDLGRLGELGFVVLHRCGEDFYFLLVCTWRNENELWETVWAKDGGTTSSSARGRSREPTVRRSACGSSAPSSTSARPGRATCSPRVTNARATPTCATPTRGLV